MNNFIDITGKKFNRLTVIKRIENSTFRKARWLCKCDCGNFTEVSGDNLRNGSVKSCGCLIKDKNKQRATHRKSNIRLYNIWRNMKARCNNSKNPDYKNYGKRGIKVCDEWINFENFYNWAINNGYKEKLSIDRVDVNKNYQPNNCRWISLKKQSYNKRNSFFINIKGEEKCLAEWCEIYNVKYSTVYRRITRNKMSIEDAILKPIKIKYRNKLYKGGK